MEREFMRIGGVRLEPSRILMYEPSEDSIRIFYDGEYPEIKGWITAWFKNNIERNKGLLELDSELKIIN